MSLNRLLEHLAARGDALEGTPGFAHFFASRGHAEARMLSQLFETVAALEAGAAHAAEGAAIELSRELGATRACTSSGDAPYVRVARSFLDALLARARHRVSGGGNLYFDARPAGAQLRAFELLRRHTPLIAFGHDAANGAILEAIGATFDGASKDVVLVDIGIGRASQHRALFEAVGGRGLLGRVHVVGVDGDPGVAATATAGDEASPPASIRALESARDAVCEGARSARVDATFEAVPLLAEELAVPALRALADRAPIARRDATGTVPFVVTSAFALHHVVDVGDNALSARDAVLRRVKAAGAHHLVLVEPDSNHFDNELMLRFLFAYRHYRTVSAALDASLEPGDADIVWNEFFAAEVSNVVTYDGVQRIERHEELARWAQRVAGAGFHVDDLSTVAESLRAPPGFDVHVDACGIRLSFEGVSLVGVLRGSA